jgi:hypothetical protein
MGLFETAFTVPWVDLAVAVVGVNQRKAALSSHPKAAICLGFLGSRRWDSNPRPAVYEVAVLGSCVFVNVEITLKYGALWVVHFSDVHFRSSGLA